MEDKTRALCSRTAENIAAVAKSVKENPGLSTNVNTPYFAKKMGLKAYKVQSTQELKPADHQQRHVSADWVVEMHENDPEFHGKIIVSDEAHLYFGGFVNKKIMASKARKTQELLLKSLSILNV